MQKNYYVDGKWFARYINARDYADQLMEESGKYFVVYTRAELDSQVQEMVDSVISLINHELECGK